YRSWLVMAPAVLLTLGLGREVFIVAVGVVSLLFVKEFARATGLYEDWGFVGVLYGAIALFALTALWPRYGTFMALPVYGVVALMMVPTFRNEYSDMIQKVGLSAIALIYLGWFPAH